MFVRRLRARTLITLVAVSCAPLAFRSALVSAQTAPSPTPPPKATSPQKTQAPRHEMTAAEHLAKAEEYKKKAAMYRAEVALHQKMLADYARDIFVPEGMVEDPDVVKMRQHCEAYIKPAEALAVEAEKFADFHRMRAAELQGR